MDKKHAREIVEALPSLYPTMTADEEEAILTLLATDKNVGNTISRQQAIDALCSICGNDCDKSEFVYNAPQDEQVIMCPEHYALSTLPPAQPETATVTIGRTRGGITMWYKCDACDEPVDQNDNYCRNCGRKLKHE